MSALTLERVKASVDKHLELWIIGGIVALVIPLIVWAARAESKALAYWEANCTQVLGGRVVSKDTTSVGINTDGSTVVTPGTDYYCLSQSGGILDVR